MKDGTEKEDKLYSHNTIVDWCKHHEDRIQDMIASQGYTELQKYRSRWYEDGGA